MLYVVLFIQAFDRAKLYLVLEDSGYNRFQVSVHILLITLIYGPEGEKTCLWGFGKSEIQTSLLSH